MTAQEYQEKAHTTAIYPKEKALEYVTLGLVGEAGEIANKVKKIIRDKNSVATEEDIKNLKSEIGDVCWYIAEMCNNLNLTIEEVFEQNIEKLFSRKERSQIKGSGDTR
jgi:NTP pyrophosphatase (non-canonical NTP hydrolase)